MFGPSEVPGMIAGQNVYVESAVLPQLMWLPDNGNAGQAPVNTSSAQNYVQPMRRGSPVVAAPLIGARMTWQVPLMNIWRFGLGVARVTPGPYIGGDQIANEGGMQWGLGSSPALLPQVTG